MTVQEFKRQFPEFAHLEGDSLWNKMEDIALENAKPASQEDTDKFFSVPKDNGKIPSESYRLLFIDVSK